jgi:hypothetical protein
MSEVTRILQAMAGGDTQAGSRLLTLDEAAEALGLARRTADRYWAYARARLFEMLSDGSGPGGNNS